MSGVIPTKLEGGNTMVEESFMKRKSGCCRKEKKKKEMEAKEVANKCL